MFVVNPKAELVPGFPKIKALATDGLREIRERSSDLPNFPTPVIASAAAGDRKGEAMSPRRERRWRALRRMII